jgi:putative transport protein
MELVASLLSHHEVLLLTVVMLLGLLLGRLEVLGVRLGPAGVLFAGLGLSAWLAPYATLRLAAPVKELGLVLFVYCVGLSSAPGFFRAFRDRGARWNVAVLGALTAGALLCVVVGRLLGLDRGQMSGVFCGALTNTPALAAATDRLHGTTYAQPVLGYSAAYPFGVLGSLLLFRLFARLRAGALRSLTPRAVPISSALSTRNFEITKDDACGKSLGELAVREKFGVLISRVHRAGCPTLVPTRFTELQLGDTLVTVGDSDALERAREFFGKISERHVEAQRENVDMRRILVSRPELVGRRLAELDLEARFNAQVTRLRRADVDVLPSPAMRLELGDRLRVVAPTAKLTEIAKYFGDSERSLAEIDFVALALGLSAGLLLAQLPLWPGSELELGIAGGPLVVSLILGRVVRTGTLVWPLPYETSNVLRQFGLLLFLAGVGIGSGAQLVTIFDRDGLHLFGLGALVTLATNTLALTLLHVLGRASAAEALGGCSGAQTQPATLPAAYELSGRSEDAYIAYAVVYPAAMIAKILLAQLIALLA